MWRRGCGRCSEFGVWCSEFGVGCGLLFLIVLVLVIVLVLDSHHRENENEYEIDDPSPLIAGSKLRVPASASEKTFLSLPESVRPVNCRVVTIV